MTQQIDIVANLLMKVDGAEAGLKKLQGSLSSLKLPKGLDSDLKKSMSNLEGLFATYRKQIEKGFDTKGDVSAFTKTARSVNAEYDKITRTLDKLNSTNVTFNVKSDNIKELEKTLDRVIKKREELSSNTKNTIANDLANIQKAGSRSTKVQDYSNMLGVAIDKGQWQNALQLAQSLKAQFEGLSEKTQQAFSKMSNGKSATAALNEIIEACRKGGEGFDKLEKEGKEAAEQLANLQAADVEKIEQALVKMDGEWQESTNGAKALNGEMTELARSTQSMSQQLGDLQQSTQYFFSLRNMINLLRRGISDAVQTVKELDAAMTETAVVTDFSVGDMWAKLPEYTANANKLGATIQDMYESTTLYYQQGLNTEQSMAIATETMKMARIAGLEAKDATDMMTAALRGFNMELNETSAERINDVYSNLAAKTASDTEEIGKAMQRTASIAHSAGMSFEGTAAFLAQAVETTREPAENIGTAMKTIVARFQEMKKNPLEITEVDGEEVSYNKVDAALQSIGVSLKDANGQFRELDKVFLDISKRWDSLSQTQQRYIATIAAGSRQQSRFIAMMGDYDRTVELMSYANDSAGASQEQFNKTLDSLEAKINKFQNAWDQFLMGIMNDSWVKGFVDAGTTILKTVNGIIDALSFGGKAKGLKSLLSIGTAGVALKAGGNLINKLIGGVGGFIDPASSFGKGFWGAGKTTQEGTPATGVAGKITTPIVAKLNELIAVTRKANNLKDTNTQVTSTLGQYKNISAMLRNPNSLNMGDIGSLFSGLSDEHAYIAYKNTPGTVDAMKQAALGWLGSKKMPADAQKTGQQLMDSIFKGMSKKEISIKDGIKLIGQPQKWGEHFGTDVAWSLSNSFSKELTSKANQEALKYLVKDPTQFQVGSKALKDLMLNENMRTAYLERFKEARAKIESENTLKDIPIEITNYQKFANKVGNLGSKFSAAGMSIQQFGIQLGQISPALEGVGTLLVRIGGALSTFGMGFSSIGSVATKAIGRISAAGVAAKGAWSAGLTAKTTANVFLGTLTEGLSAGAIGGIIGTAIIGGILIAKGIADKKAREAGEEVRENFEQGFTETNKKIDSISDYKDRFNELSQGVDQFGHNINLTDEEFDEYLTISRELQELSPSLISGYNAEGQAILRKGAALDEVIDKLKEERDLSLRDYITDDSIGKLIGEYNTSDAYKSHNTIRKGDSGMGDAFEAEKSSISKAIKEAELEWSDFSQILDELGIGGAESINDLTNQQLSMITAHYTDVINKIKEFNPQIEEEAEEGLKEAFAETNNALEDVLTEGAPIVDALRQWMGQEKLDAVGLGLSEEFVSGFNSGLDGLMLEGLTNNWKPEEYKAQLRDYANEWEYLAGPTSTYSTILSEADKIQQQYLDHIGEDGAIEDYENDVEGLATQLESLAEQYKGTGAAGEVFAEQCQQQANNLRNYATEGVVSLSEALNTLSDEFASARGAQERFQKATESGDYYTAAEGYKSIIDTMLDEKNVTGDGSLAFWAGADELLGQQFVDSHTSDEIVKQVEKIQSCFEDGLPGVQAFGDLLVENADKLKGLGEINKDTGQFEFNFKNLDDLEKYAELLGISEDALAALIDKSRQYVSWNLSDPGEIRKAIEDSQYSMAGVSTKGENLVYTSESQFRAEARQQGIRGDDYTSTKADAEERGVRFLNVENLTAKKGDGLYADQVLENIGLKGQDKTVENAVAAFTKMGLDLEDTKQVLMSDGIKLANGEEATAENIEKAYNEQAYAMENPTVAGIASDTSTLVSNTSAMLAAMGILTDDAKKEINQATSDETTQGYIDNLNNASNLDERNQARTTMEDKVSEYNALANKLIESGRTETDPYVQKLRGAAEALQTELDAEAENWNNKAVAANQYLKNNNIIPQEATAEEQKAIQLHAVDIQSAIETGDANTVIETLKQIETEGNLSIETMIGLGQSISNLGAVDSSSILHFISEYYEKLKLAKQESDQPFEIETKFTGEKLEDHISKIKEFTTQEYAFLVRADVTGEEKVSTLINSINQEFGKGDEETKTILIDAVAKTASGDKEGAHDILAEAFGEDKAETIEKKIDVLCDGSIANKEEVTNALKGELEKTTVEPTIKVKAKASIDNINTDKKLKHQTGTINYTTGDVAPVAAQTTKLNYTTGDIPPVPAQRTDLNFNVGNIPSIPDQEVNIYPKLKGSGTYTVIANARGRNYSIPARSSLSFGSAAQGMNLPKKKRLGSIQTTALVGEEGFEIGYIPSEARSVIFGASGPEMTSFPSDTVIYPHKQSKEILRRGKGGHKSLGSFVNGNTGKSSGIPTSTNGSGDSGNNKRDKNKDKHKKGTDKQQKKNADNAAKVIKKAGNINAWWWNMGKKVEATQRLIDKTFKKIEKLTNTVGTSLASISKEGDFYIKKLNKQISLNTTMMDKAQKQLNTLDKGAGSKKKKSVKAAQAKVDRAEAKVKKAQKNHNKKAEKQAKKELKKAKKNLRKKQNTANYSTISYDVTVQKKNKKGKVTKTKKNKKQRMDLSPYVKLDEATGAYVVDYKKINSKNWDKSKKKAVMEAAEKKAETYQKRRDTAEDNIEKAQEALDELGKNLYETFLSWEIELTRIWNISQKIAESEARRERAESFSELLDVQLGNGVKRILNADGSINQEYLDKITNTFEKGVQEQVNTITLTQESIGIKANELYKSLSTTGEQTTLGNVQRLVENAKFTNNFLADAEKELDKASTAAQKVANAKEDKAEAKEDKKEAKDKKKKAKKTKTKKDDKKAQDKINEAQKAIDKANDIIDKQSQIATEAQTAAEDYQKQAEFYIQQNNGRTYTDTEILAYEREIKELEDQIKIKNAALEFTKVTPNTDGTVTIDFHTEEFEKARQEGRFTAADAEKIQAYVQKLVDDSKDIQETYKTLTDQLTTLNTTLTELQEAWVGYADDLLSYLEEEQSKEITKLKTLSDSIKDSLSKLLDQVKKTLQERRNQEDNAKTEQDILRKQQRLAALRANTSGGNQVEIAQLEREINEAQTSYGRTLEDQLLDRLSNQADEAAEQREKQIKIQEGIRDTVNNAATVNKWMSSPAMFQDAIRQAFFSAQDWENMPLAKQEAIEKSFQTFYAGLLTNQKKQTTIADAIQTTSSMVEFIEDSLGGNVGQDITDDTANTDSLDTTVREIAADINSNINRSQNVITQQVTNTAAEANAHTDEQFDKKQAIDDYRNQKVIAINDKTISATELKSLITKGTAAEMTESDVVVDLAGTDELTWKEIIQAAKDAQFSSSQVLGWFQDSWPANRKNYFNNAYNTIYKPKTKRKTNYKTGGLADFTGPAWLDGTPSKPELVLNAKDTQNFIALKNILSKAIGSTNSIMTSYGGNATYEININVDHLSNDYDVDRVAERVKKIIVKDSSYRNVTQVRNFR